VDEDEKKILLGLKKRGFGVGKWNGFGGKVEASDKNILDAALRELKEEAGVSVSAIVQQGVLIFEFEGDPRLHEVHVFRAEAPVVGTLTESDEMYPKWFKLDEIPYNRMFADDEHWYSLLFARRAFRGYFRFDGDFMSHFVLEPLKDLALVDNFTKEGARNTDWYKHIL